MSYPREGKSIFLSYGTLSIKLRPPGPSWSACRRWDYHNLKGGIDHGELIQKRQNLLD